MARTEKEKRLLYEKNEEVRKQQSYWVVKRNDLITHSRYSLTLSQQRLLLFLISKIAPYDDIENEYRVRIKDIIDVCEYDKTSGTYYKLIKRDLLVLRNSAIWMETARGLETIGWLSKAILIKPATEKDYQEIVFKFDSGLEPYLFQLKSFYTQYNLENIITLSHKYSLRLYEYLMSYANLMYVIVSVDDLKMRLDAVSVDDLKMRLNAQSYSKYNHFKERILKPSVDEINKKTNLYIEYDELKTGKAVKKIAFYIWGVNEDSKDYTIEDMRIRAGVKADVNRRVIKDKKQKIDKENYIKVNGEITAQLSLFEDS